VSAVPATEPSKVPTKEQELVTHEQYGTKPTTEEGTVAVENSTVTSQSDIAPHQTVSNGHDETQSHKHKHRPLKEGETEEDRAAKLLRKKERAEKRLQENGGIPETKEQRKERRALKRKEKEERHTQKDQKRKEKEAKKQVRHEKKDQNKNASPEVEVAAT
jgi:hypothetical protein